MTEVFKSCEKCSLWKEVKQRLRIAEVLTGIIDGFKERINNKELKPTVAEYLKLLEVEQEFELESPKEIKVTWVEKPTPSNGGK